MRRTRFLPLGLALTLLLLSGCTLGPGASKGQISFREIFEERREDELQIERTEELDADGDGEDEWLVLYRYDATRGFEWEHAPMQGIVYDAVPCDPPVIQSWRLPTPDNDYVGEGDEAEAYMADWLASTDPRLAEEELIVEGPGPVNTLSIYRYHDYQQDPCKPPDPARQGFDLLGFFRSNGRILWDERARTITTYQRTSFERSQLAVRSTFAPASSGGNESFLNAAGQTKAPDEQTIDFLYSQPTSPLDSPYPEKAVAAFYLSIGQENDRAQSFLTDDLATVFNDRTWGLDNPPSGIKRALIYSISYSPDRDAELRREDREVTIVVAGVNQNNERMPARRVTWRVVGIPIPGEQECEWRLAEIRSVIVTPGLGMDVPQEGAPGEVALVP